MGEFFSSEDFWDRSQGVRILILKMKKKEIQILEFFMFPQSLRLSPSLSLIIVMPLLTLRSWFYFFSFFFCIQALFSASLDMSPVRWISPPTSMLIMSTAALTQRPRVRIPLKPRKTFFRAISQLLKLRFTAMATSVTSFVFPQFTSFHSVFHSFHGLKCMGLHSSGW